VRASFERRKREGGPHARKRERTASADGDSKVGQEVYYDVGCVETVMIETRRDEKKSACERQVSGRIIYSFIADVCVCVCVDVCVCVCVCMYRRERACGFLSLSFSREREKEREMN